MKMRPLTAMFGLATATLLACSSAPPPNTGTAGTNGAAGQSAGTAGTQAGTAGQTGTAGEPAGTAGQTGTAGVQAGTGGSTGAGGMGTGGIAAAGATGTGGVATGGTTGTAGTGTAGATGTGGATACPAGVSGHCNADTAAAPTHAGYTLALAEEFDAPIDLDKDPIWTWSDGSPADGQTRFRASQISFAGGMMKITATSPCAAGTNNTGCIPGGDKSYAEPVKNQTTGTIGNMGVWSGEMRTKYNNYRYGWYEARYHAPIANMANKDSATSNGDFLSTMFVFRSPKWQEWNEIDIELEPNILTHLAGNVVNAMGATGYPAGNASPINTAAGLPVGYKNYDTHTYAFDWQPNKVTWYVDGMMSTSFGGSGSDPVPPKSAKIMMNLWVFSGTAFGDGANNKFDFFSEYEYFRFYKADAEAMQPVHYPCSPTPSCLPASDLDFAQNNGSEVNYGM